MAPANLSPNSVIDLLNRRRETERRISKERDERYALEQNQKLAELQSLQEEQSRIKATINKNLERIAVHRHGLRKLVRSPQRPDAPKLPVTHKYQRDAVDFVSRAINFVNNFPEIQNSVEPESDVNTAMLCDQVNTWAESVNEQLGGSKARVDQIETLDENMEIIKNECSCASDEF